jgi:gliding motility-associated-like protein
MKGLSLLIVSVTVSVIAIGQPRIENVERIAGFPFNTVQITGVGFSSNAADLQVWFGGVKGTIVPPSTESLITVTVPASARLAFVEVINVATKRSAKSNKKFMPVFSGVQPFTNNFSVTSSTNADDIFDLCSCDFDSDGKPDIAGSKFKDGKSNIMMLRNTSTVAANNTTTSFAQSSITLAFPTFSVSCGDINGDGKPDLVASRGGTSTGNSIFVFQNTSAAAGSITFAAPVQLDITVGAFAKQINIRDLNRDGRPELIVTNGQSNTIYIFENKLTTNTIVAGEFTRVDRIVTGAVSTDGSLALETADLTGDGWPEIIVAPNANATKVFILTNPANGTVTFSTVGSITIGGGQNINDLAIADFNADGSLDFVIADRSSAGGKAFVFLNRGGLIFQSVNSTTGFPAPVAWGVDVADMNGDGFTDFIISNRKFSVPEEINFFISDGAATPNFTKSTITTTKASWFSLAGDFDGDSKPDIAVTSTNNATQFSIDVWKNRNCHQAVILNENPLTICSPQIVPLKAVPLQGVSFSWSTGDTGPTSNVDVTDAGTVTVTAVGDGGTCSTQANITIVNGGGTAPANPVITGPAGVCAGNSLALSTSTTADVYEWTGPNNFTSAVQNPPAITNVSTVHAGLYRLRVKTGGCFSDIVEKQVDVIAPDAFSVSSSIGTSGVCTGQPATLNVTSVSGYNYQWKKDGVNVGTNSTSYSIPSVAESDQGNYTVFISHQTVTCTSETSSFPLNVVTAPVASFTRTPALICVGTQAAFNASASTVDNTVTANYAWTFGDASNGTGVTATHTYTAAQSNVTVTLTISYSGVTGCTNNSTPPTFNVNAATAPVIALDPVVTEICPDGSETVALSVSGSFTSFDWSTGGTTASIQVDEPGTYSVETVDANGCTGNAQIILTEKTGCEGGEISPSIPKVFTPNGDLANDLWVITDVPNIQECQINIFDGRGRRVFETKSFPVTGWDGVANGKPVPDGTYYYVIGCPDSKPVTGSILIVR